MTLVTNGLTENVFRLSHFGITKNRKKDTHRSLWLLVFKKKELFIPFVPFHLHISHKTLCLTPKFCIRLCFSFSGITLIPREIEGNVFAKVWGVNKVYYGRCANGESSRTMPQSRVKEPEIHGLFGEYRRTLNRGGGGGGNSLQGISLV